MHFRALPTILLHVISARARRVSNPCYSTICGISNIVYCMYSGYISMHESFRVLNIRRLKIRIHDHV